MTDAAWTALAAVAVALITVGLPLVWQVRRVDRRNTDQHAENGTVLSRIEHRQTRMLDLLTDHVTDRSLHNGEQETDTNPDPRPGRRGR